jgi:hypothetical protein
VTLYNTSSFFSELYQHEFQHIIDDNFEKKDPPYDHPMSTTSELAMALQAAGDSLPNGNASSDSSSDSLSAVMPSGNMLRNWCSGQAPTKCAIDWKYI